jgi:hypothetical protein
VVVRVVARVAEARAVMKEEARAEARAVVRVVGATVVGMTTAEERAALEMAAAQWRSGVRWRVAPRWHDGQARDEHKAFGCGHSGSAAVQWVGQGHLGLTSAAL